LGFQLQGDLRLLAANIEKVIEPAAMRLGAAVQMAVQRRNIPPPPGDGDQQNKGAEVLKMVPVERIFKGFEKRFQFFGKTDDLEHNGSLLCKRASINNFIEESDLYLLNSALGWFHDGGVSLTDTTEGKGLIFDGGWHEGSA
jgi:hypothetical protein